MIIIDNLTPRLSEMHAHTLRIIEAGIVALMKGEHLPREEVKDLPDSLYKRLQPGYSESETLQEMVENQGEVTLTIDIHPYEGRTESFRNNILVTVSSQHYGDSLNLRIPPPAS